MISKYPLVAVAIMNWNGMEIKYDGKPILKRCLESLMKVSYPNAKFILVDAGSVDNSIQFVRKNYPKIEIKRVEDKGTPYTSNEGVKFALRYSDAKYILLAQNDLEFHESGWLKKMVDVLEKNEDIGAVESKLIDPRGGIQYAGHELSSMVVVRILTDPKIANTSRYRDTVSTMLLLVRRELFMKIGGFDEVFAPFCWEDTDFSRRVTKSGSRLYYLGTTKISHLGSYSLRNPDLKKKWTSDMIEFSQRRNAYIFHLRYKSYRLPLHFITDTISNVINVKGVGFGIRKNIVSRTKMQLPAIRDALKLYNRDQIRKFTKT